MAGHKSKRNNLGPAKPEPTATRMTAVLDQLATDANTQRRTDPAMIGLEVNLKLLRAEYDRLCGHLDEETAGAALMVVGQLLAGHVNAQPEQDAKIEALASLPNLMRLVGAELYAGTTSEVEVRCPFTYLNGAPCTKKVTAGTQAHAELLLKGHVWQNHPDEEWPPAQDEDGAPEQEQPLPLDEIVVAGDGLAELVGAEGEVSCACGNPAVMVVGTTNHPDGQPGSARAVCRDCASIEQVGSATGGRNAKHAPHEPCDCRPGEVWHCAAAADGEGEG